MTIKVLGLGCMNCRTLERRTRDALTEMKLDAVIVSCTLEEIAEAIELSKMVK